ncbi:phosphonopyruvate decarboxylase [Roseomonas terrae]|uniref:Phosphonopyruvate decarboxylase n=1 Tax=Neoroseomonas terrae TaxID=424799 RepID=A0ABS5EJ13_9PROT|nr:thiamine pyrophosphate-binding protein [Neoroseomonas terrae]MBR0650945.1 phosphonopyruvate decarboxylase [Neoroseomonas terrae]
MDGSVSAEAVAWPDAIFAALRQWQVRQVVYVPDGGHARLIRSIHAEPSMRAIPLTTEEEGIAVLSGAALGGQRGVMLMQSSGVGNCVNMLSLVKTCGFPFLALVTMRGEWGEFNPWQVPMGSTTEAAFKLMGVETRRADRVEDVADTVNAAARMVFEGGSAVAVLLGQRLIGAKVF